jgi:tRNA1Val (adenine37-N6)-methyltransferase
LNSKVSNQLQLKPDERLDDLIRNDLKIIQNPKYFCFSIDAVLLAHFSTIKNGDKVMDIGTGSGVIPLLLSLRPGIKSILGVEIQEQLADMAKRSVLINNLEQQISILNEDVKGLNLAEKFDLILSNPPYRGLHEGKVSPVAEIAMAKHEVAANLDDIVKKASQHLKSSGRLAMVHRPYRLADIIQTFRKYNIEPKRVRMVHPYLEKDANLVLIEGVKGAQAYLKVEPPLVVYNTDGKYTKEVLEFYYGK